MKEVTQPWAGNPAEAELGRLYIGSPCVPGRLQVEGFPTIAARSASGRVHVCSTALLAHFFHERSAAMLQPPAPRGGPTQPSAASLLTAGAGRSFQTKITTVVFFLLKTSVTEINLNVH